MRAKNSILAVDNVEALPCPPSWLRRAVSCAAIVVLAACGGGGGGGDTASSGNVSNTGSGSESSPSPVSSSTPVGNPGGATGGSPSPTPVNNPGTGSGGSSSSTRQVVVVGHVLSASPGSPPNGRMWRGGVETALPLSATGQSTAVAAAFLGETPVVAGQLLFHTGPLNSYDEPKLWYDGVTPQALATTIAAPYQAAALQIQGNDIHVAGTRKSGNSKVVYWKNGQLQYVSDGSHETALGMAVNGEGVVHICGFDQGTGSLYVPVCWRNGVKTQLSTNLGMATGVATRSFDVYASGFMYFAEVSAGVAVVWTNGSAQRLGNGTTPSTAWAVAVGGLNDVYAVGRTALSTLERAALWKNGVEQTLEGAGVGSSANAIQVVGTDVYVAGHIGQTDGKRQRAALWVNGKLQVLSDGATVGTALGLAVR